MFSECHRVEAADTGPHRKTLLGVQRTLVTKNEGPIQFGHREGYMLMHNSQMEVL